MLSQAHSTLISYCWHCDYLTEGERERDSQTVGLPVDPNPRRSQTHSGSIVVRSRLTPH